MLQVSVSRKSIQMFIIVMVILIMNSNSQHLLITCSYLVLTGLSSVYTLGMIVVRFLALSMLRNITYGMHACNILLSSLIQAILVEGRKYSHHALSLTRFSCVFSN